MELSKNNILITGGASGIGLGLTERFLQENNTVIICGRRAQVLNEVTDKYPQVISRVCDLSDESQRIALCEWLAKEHSDLTVLVNNAGIQNWMGIDDQDFYKKATGEIAIYVFTGPGCLWMRQLPEQIRHKMETRLTKSKAGFLFRISQPDD